MNEKDFALRLAQLRMQKGVSARDMSISMGQNQNYINHIETGRTSPSLSGIYYICEYLGISVSEFFDEENKNPTKLDEIMQDLRRLTPSQLETVSQLVKQLANK